MNQCIRLQHAPPLRSVYAVLAILSLWGFLGCQPAARQTAADAGVVPDRACKTSGAGSSQGVAQTAGGELLLAEARRQMGNMRVSNYQHRTAVREDAGSYAYDCSGFLTYSLGRAMPQAVAALPVSTSSRPIAKDVYAHITQSPAAEGGLVPGMGGWLRVERVADLMPGDVVAWLTPPGVQKSDSGHVMIVAAIPHATVRDDREFAVRVVDSTASPHADDTRPRGSTGLGSGVIGLIVDAQGRPVAYRWRAEVSPKAWATSIALGRIQAGP